MGLKIISKSNIKPNRKIVICDCGSDKFEVTDSMIINNYVEDCGCKCSLNSLKVDYSRTKIFDFSILCHIGKNSGCGCERYKLNGLSSILEYNTYRTMINRCINSNSIDYTRYGGKGISICKRWLKSFENFYEDMGLRPTNEHSLDRIDNNGNYEPSNCRWTTSKQQILNSIVTKLKQEEVDTIRQKYLTGNFSQQQLADEFNCSGENISAITRYKNWR